MCTDGLARASCGGRSTGACTLGWSGAALGTWKLATRQRTGTLRLPSHIPGRQSGRGRGRHLCITIRSPRWPDLSFRDVTGKMGPVAICTGAYTVTSCRHHTRVTDLCTFIHYPSPDPSDIWRMSKHPDWLPELGGFETGLPAQQPAPLMCAVRQAPRPGSLCPTPT